MNPFDLELARRRLTQEASKFKLPDIDGYIDRAWKRITPNKITPPPEAPTEPVIKNNGLNLLERFKRGLGGIKERFNTMARDSRKAAAAIDAQVAERGKTKPFGIGRLAGLGSRAVTGHTIGAALEGYRDLRYPGAEAIDDGTIAMASITPFLSVPSTLTRSGATAPVNPYALAAMAVAHDINTPFADGTLTGMYSKGIDPYTGLKGPLPEGWRIKNGRLFRGQDMIDPSSGDVMEGDALEKASLQSGIPIEAKSSESYMNPGMRRPYP